MHLFVVLFVILQISLVLSQKVIESRQQMLSFQKRNKKQMENKLRPLKIKFDYLEIIKSEEIPIIEKRQIASLCKSLVKYFGNLIKIKGKYLTEYKKSESKNPNSEQWDIYIQLQIKKFIKNPIHMAISDIKEFISKNGQEFATKGIIFLNSDDWFLDQKVMNLERHYYFQNYQLPIVQHEIIHILGFNIVSMKKFTNINSQKATINTRAKYLQATIKKISNSNTIQEIPFEIGTTHFKERYFENEMMNPTTKENGLFLSIFSTSLLKDIGWYYINERMAYPYNYGIGIGNIQQKNVFQQNQIDDLSLGQCTFFNKGKGEKFTHRSDDTQQINWIQVRESTSCEKPKILTEDDQKKFNSYGWNSKCFVSQLKNYKIEKRRQRHELRCHSFKCNKETQTISIFYGENEVICEKGQEGKKILVEQANGIIKCPKNYDEFCQTRQCENYCSSNGYCVKGNCVCNFGFAGIGCEKKCRYNIEGRYLQNGECVKSCSDKYVSNPNKVCLKDCPEGYYIRGRHCEKCDLSCATCNGPRRNNCLSCNFLGTLYNNICYTWLS